MTIPGLIGGHEDRVLASIWVGLAWDMKDRNREKDKELLLSVCSLFLASGAFRVQY